ncbi:MAG: hypothetical protein QM667_10410 [Asticcacaulis sp.]
MTKTTRTSLYTVVLDYDGGTYISQVRAPDERAALFLWCDRFEAAETAAKTRKVASKVRKSLDDDRPVLLSGCEFVWCATASRKGKFILINIVKTAG